MNKSGSVFLKILIVVGIIVLVLVAIVGVSAYQASRVVRVMTEEGAKIEISSRLMIEQKDCTRIAEIEESMQKIEKEAISACKNPVLNLVIEKVETIPIKCETLPEFKEDFQRVFATVKLYCEDTKKINESIYNNSISKEELMALAQKYGIKV